MGSFLLIGDIVGCGNLGMSVMIPILSKMGYEIYRLPSSLVSNNFSYGDFAVLDTTEYMCKCIDIWEDIGLKVDAVATGYLVSEEQTQIVADYCEKMKQRGTKIFVDPIMADNGMLYNGANEHTVKYMREMCKVADLIVPNITEAKFLADMFIGRDSISMTDSMALMETLGHKFDCEVVVTSAMVEDTNCTLTYQRSNNETTCITYEPIPAQFSGTGDVFASILFGHYLRGESLMQSVRTAMLFVAELIKRNQGKFNPDNGIPIEKHFDDIEF